MRAAFFPSFVVLGSHSVIEPAFFLSVPILALVDGDAYGIDILSVYKHGSTRMRHENDHLAADRLQWIGLWASELASYVVLTLRGGSTLIFHPAVYA